MACTPPTIIVGGVEVSTSDFQNAQELFDKVSDASGDPSLDEYEENVAGGNNEAGKSGILLPSDPNGKIPKQTKLPDPISQKSKEINDKAAPGKNGTPVPGSAWDGKNYDAQLSPNFQLKQFTINALFKNFLTDYNAQYSAQVRFRNLQNLAVNVAEPLLAKFGKLNINSGIRNKTSGTSGLSQHITGEAFDAQFSGWNYARYWENAQWVRDNIPFDQFIFEHSGSTGLAWFHLSYKSTGNRAPSLPTKIMTMYRNKYSPGLHRFG